MFPSSTSNLNLAKAVHTTSPGGPLHDTQKYARMGLAGFSDLIKQVSRSGFADDEGTVQ